MTENLVALSNMKEFNPAFERHFPVLIVKAVDPGCTLELQIESAHDGSVIRLTTTESPEVDKKVFLKAVTDAFTKAWAVAEATTYSKDVYDDEPEAVEPEDQDQGDLDAERHA